MAILNEAIAKFEEGKMIRTFKTLQFMEDGNLIENVNWRTMKAKELFAYLLQHKQVAKEEIMERLWPEYETKQARQNLYTTIYQIKDLLKSIHFPIDIKNKANFYEMNLHGVHVDIEVFQEVFDQFDQLTEENFFGYHQLMQYYIGDYLQEENFRWRASRSEQMKILYITMINTMIDFLRERERMFDALLLALTIQQYYPTYQNNYLLLMQLYDEIGEYDKVELQYNLLHESSQKEPKHYIVHWYNQWKEDQDNQISTPTP